MCSISVGGTAFASVSGTEIHVGNLQLHGSHCRRLACFRSRLAILFDDLNVQIHCVCFDDIDQVDHS